MSQHKTPEQMIEEGHHLATFEDLEGVDNRQLLEVAMLCNDEPADPEACVPCRAFVILQEREVEDIASKDRQEAVEEFHQEAAEEEAYRYEDEYQAKQEKQEKPVVEQFAEAVHTLDELVVRLIEGPPIPPPNVTVQELAALVVGAKKWLHMIDAQGLELAPAQEKIRAEIERVVERVSHG